MKRSRKGPRLTSTQVRIIRHRAALGEDYASIGKAHRITPAHVGRIVRGEVWGELGGPIKTVRRAGPKGLLVKPKGTDR